MELNKQVCSRQQADRLRELGVTAPSLFYYTIGDKIRVRVKDVSGLVEHAVAILTPEYTNLTCCHAYTVAELGAMLRPVMDEEVKGADNIMTTVSQIHGNKMSCTFSPLFLADCIIALLESKLITPEQCATNLNH